MNSPSQGAATRITRFRESCVVVRDAVLALAVAVVTLMLLISPGVVGDHLARAGFVSADVAGFRWELQKAQEDTQTSKTQVEDLRRKLARQETALVDLRTAATQCTPQVQAEFERVSREATAAKKAATNIGSTLDASLVRQSRILTTVNRLPMVRTP